MAQIARIAFSNKTIRSISLKKSHIIASNMHKTGYHVKTTNKLLRDNLPLIGGKTGYTSRAGHCLASEFISGHDIVLIVVLGSPDHFRDTRLVYRNLPLRKPRLQQVRRYLIPKGLQPIKAETVHGLGSEKRKFIHSPGLVSHHIRPPWASMILRML